MGYILVVEGMRVLGPTHTVLSPPNNQALWKSQGDPAPAGQWALHAELPQVPGCSHSLIGGKTVVHAHWGLSIYSVRTVAACPGADTLRAALSRHERAALALQGLWGGWLNGQNETLGAVVDMVGSNGIRGRPE